MQIIIKGVCPHCKRDIVIPGDAAQEKEYDVIEPHVFDFINAAAIFIIKSEE